jgi:hypothetical protein
LSEPVAQNAFVTWLTHPAPWVLEEGLIATLRLPLNLEQNDRHPFRCTMLAVFHPVEVNGNHLASGAPSLPA